MTIREDQSIELVRALFSQQVVGSDAEGNEYGPERNAHFLAALRVMYPGLPQAYYLLQSIVIPPGANPEDYRHKQLADRKEKRKAFAEILRDIATAFEDAS